jgi:TQXA domain-containing protein/LPXTG-motif cell wall-anchored protein
VAGASVAALITAIPAAADGARAEFQSGAHTPGYTVNLGKGHQQEETTLFALRLDGGGLLRTYCVEISVKVDPSRPMLERSWDRFPNPDSPFHAHRTEINWVLHHGYPAIKLAALEKELTGHGVDLHNGLNRREAIAGTQAAVWHYSDAKNLDRETPVPGHRAAGADVLALYDYLTGEDNVGIGEQPTPALQVTPKDITGEAGERIGPFTVSTTGRITSLSAELPDDVTLTDAEGNELTASEIGDSTEIYLDVPADAEAGEGSFRLKGRAHLDTGRLFVSEHYQQKPAQSLIVAESDKANLAATASVHWTAAPATTPSETSSATPAPTTSSEAAPVPTTETPVSPQSESGELAQTGFSALTPVLIGVGLLAVGGLLLLLQRRRRGA